jgi:hypothetical protein
MARDTFPEGKMPVEAAALMYLALGAEEIRTHKGTRNG